MDGDRCDSLLNDQASDNENRNAINSKSKDPRNSFIKGWEENFVAVLFLTFNLLSMMADFILATVLYMLVLLNEYIEDLRCDVYVIDDNFND